VKRDEATREARGFFENKVMVLFSQFQDAFEESRL